MEVDGVVYMEQHKEPEEVKNLSVLFPTPSQSPLLPSIISLFPFRSFFLTVEADNRARYFF
jgi:hypothetical protein